MVLTKYQIKQNQLSSNNIGSGSSFVLRNSIWTSNWNDTEYKYFIPFQHHPDSHAQENYIHLMWRFLFDNENLRILL